MTAPIPQQVFETEVSAPIAVTRSQAKLLGQLATEAECIYRGAVRLQLQNAELAVELDADLSEDFAHFVDAADAVAGGLTRFADLVGHAFAASNGAAAVDVPVHQHHDVELLTLPLWVDGEMFARVAAEYRAELRRRRA